MARQQWDTGASAARIQVGTTSSNVVAAVDGDAVQIPVLALARHVVTALEDQGFLAGWRQTVRERTTAPLRTR